MEYKSPKIIALEIDEFDDESGTDGIALVSEPAIQEDFYFFSAETFESYTDYPKQAIENAKVALRYADENGWGSCGTPVGKARANQLANGEPISEETIARMASFERQRQNSDKELGDGCGRLMWLAWGGDAGVEWAQRKLQQIRREELAEVGPRGGIKASPKAPKSDTKNPNPKGEGTAGGDASGKRGAKVTAEQEKTLQGKVDDFNKKESNTKNGRAALGALKSVFQRGLGAYNTSRSPNVRSAEQWAYARVNAFLYLLKNGRPQNKKYITDNDLLPNKHPKYSEKKEKQSSQESLYEDYFMEGVPHYTKDGELWTGPTHKHNDRLMTGETHTEDSEFLYHIEELILEYLLHMELSTQELDEEQEELVLQHLEGLGETEEELLAQGWVKIDEEQQFKISSTPNLPSIEDSGDRIYRYQYAGPVDDKNRTFCSRIMKMNKLYRKEDINQMTITGENSEFAQKGSFTYDIFAFAGGKYCRHRWIKVPFKKEDIKSQFSEINTEKQLIAGPLMIPRKLIARFNEIKQEVFYVYFTEETIEKVAYKYLMNKYQDKTNLEHSEDIKLKDVILVESWLVEDPEKDKSYSLTGKKYPKGTWFGIMKVLNKTVWKEWIKTGRVKGFSVEGYYIDRMINL